MVRCGTDILDVDEGVCELMMNMDEWRFLPWPVGSHTEDLNTLTGAREGWEWDVDGDEDGDETPQVAIRPNTSLSNKRPPGKMKMIMSRKLEMGLEGPQRSIRPAIRPAQIAACKINN